MRESIYNGQRVYRPDYIKVGRMAINPDAAPLDEAMRFVKTCVDVWLAKYKVWSYSIEDMQDLENECVYRTYKRLVEIVCTGQYDRKHSFYCNVRGCAWAEVGHAVRIWIDRQRHALNEASIYDTIPDSDVRFVENIAKAPAFIRTGELNKNKSTLDRDLDSYKLEGARLNAARIQAENEWWLYLEMCDEHGIDPADKADFMADNGLDVQAEDPSLESRRAYHRHYIHRKKLEDPAWWSARQAYQAKYAAKRKKDSI